MNRKLAVLGLGIENLALVKYLAGKGDELTVCDSRDRIALGERYELLTQLGVTFRLGPDYLERLEDFDTVFRSPGLPLFQPELRQAEAKGVEVTSAMRLFLDLCPCPTIGVTGSKGKGTTSSLIHRILTLSQAKRVPKLFWVVISGSPRLSFSPVSDRKIGWCWNYPVFNWKIVIEVSTLPRLRISPRIIWHLPIL